MPTETSNPKQEEQEQEEPYPLNAVVVDAFARKLGFGTPLRDQAAMRLSQQASQRQDELHQYGVAEEERLMQARNAMTSMAPYMSAVSKPGSRYYKDLSHLMGAVNRSPESMAYFGGKHEAKDTGQKDAAGDTIYDIMIRDPESDEVLEQYQATTPGTVDRFDASLDPQSRLEVREAIRAEVVKQQRDLDLLEKYRDAGATVKKTLGLPATIIDSYLDFKNHPPPGTEKMKDWQIWEAVGGSPIPQRYKVVGNQYVKHGKDGAGILVQDRENQKIEIYPIEGLKWDEVKKNVKKESLKWKKLYWPDSDTDLAFVKMAKGIFARRIDMTADTTGKAILMHLVLPKFQEWIESHSGVVKDTQGQDRQLTAVDVTDKLNTLVGGKEEKAPAAPAPVDDKGDFRSYLPKKITSPKTRLRPGRQGMKVAQEQLTPFGAAEYGRDLQNIVPRQGGPIILPSAKGSEPAGQLVPGNIDIDNRKVLKNPDGSISTESSISIGTDKGEVLIPTIIDGKRVTTEEAISQYETTGEHLGIFKDSKSADKYAKQLHNRQSAGAKKKKEKKSQKTQLRDLYKDRRGR